MSGKTEGKRAIRIFVLFCICLSIFLGMLYYIDKQIKNQRRETDCIDDYTYLEICPKILYENQMEVNFEEGIMTRILKGLNFKKPGIYIIAIIAVLVIGAVILFAKMEKKPETVTVKGEQPYVNTRLDKEKEASGSDKMNAQTETENTGTSISDTEQHSMQIPETELEGGQMGFISGFLESGGKQLVFDCAEWIADMSEPNGFRIENPEKEELTYKVDENTEYGIIDRTGGAVVIKVDKDTFTERVEEYESFGTLNTQPFIIKEQDGIIRLIYQRYVP